MTHQQQQQWSPFECLAVASLTQSGLLQKEPDEVELFSRQSIELRSAMATATEPMVPIQVNGLVARGLSPRDWVDRCENLALTITTHRIVLTKQLDNSNEQQQGKEQQQGVQARFIHLSHLLECRPEKTSMFASPKVLLTTYSGDFFLVFRGSSSKQDRDDCCDCIATSVRRLQEWQATATSKTIKAAEQQAVQKRKVGVDAILSQSAYRHEQAVQVTQQAFDGGDAETLLKEAGDLVQIIKKYVGMLDKQQEGMQDHELDSQQKEDATKLAALLQDMGMASALVKSDFRGREEAYYQQTARQLADFVRPKLKQAGGFMTLTDVYCLYNRARASNLISPEDLLTACSYMPSLHLGMSQRHFPSGLTVLQDDAVDDEKSAALLVAACADHDTDTHTQSGITADQAAKYLKLSAVLAHEQLLAAELAGALVRDETLESLRFFPNRFQEFVDAL
jgi:ESCRT-II complex subunit VPS36